MNKRDQISQWMFGMNWMDGDYLSCQDRLKLWNDRHSDIVIMPTQCPNPEELKPLVDKILSYFEEHIYRVDA